MERICIHIVFILIITLQACKHEKENPLGNPICASSSFRMTDEFKLNNSTDSDQHIDFTYSPYYVTLTAAFNEEVSWKIIITGKTSGAVKTYTGVSSPINVKWYGNADGDVFFKTGETCTISLIPACKSAIVLTAVLDHFSIFDHYGYLVMDLDYVFPVYRYVSDVPGIETYVRNVDTTLADPSPQGGRCQKLYAPLNHSGWYIGGFGSDTDLSDFALNMSSDSVYINFYLRGSDIIIPNTNTVAMISMKERVNGLDYVFNKGITINWTGWKFISMKLSDISIGVPANIKNIDIQAGPNTYNAETVCYVDFVIITKGKPFMGPN